MYPPLNLNLSFHTGSNAFRHFSQGTGPIYLSNLQCVGDEARLADCPFAIGRACSHSEDAGVICQVTTGM